MEKKAINKEIKKVWVSDEVADFIRNHNCISMHNKKNDLRTTIYWNNCKYIETEDNNVFEVLFENDVLSGFINGRHEKEDNS